MSSSVRTGKIPVSTKYDLIKKKLLHSLGLVYKSMRGMMTNSIDRDQWLNVTSESRDRIWPFFFLIIFKFRPGSESNPRPSRP
jgi:hypothetical protein